MSETKRVTITGGPLGNETANVNVHTAAVGYGWKDSTLVTALRRVTEDADSCRTRIGKIHSINVRPFEAEAGLVAQTGADVVRDDEPGFELFAGHTG